MRIRGRARHERTSAAADGRWADELRPAFVEADTERRFTRDGFVVLPYFDAGEIERARVLFDRFDSHETDGFHADFERLGDDDRRAAYDDLAWCWQKALDQTVDHRPYLVTFLHKVPGEASEVKPHQDWSHTDESRHRAFLLWVALDDTDVELDNGPMMVIPGSHELAFEYRAHATPPWWTGREAELDDLFVPVPVKAGEAIAFDNRVIHRSPPNNSPKVRRTVVAHFAPREAGLVFAAGEPDGRVHLHRLPDDCFFRRTPRSLTLDPPDPALASATGLRSVCAPSDATLAAFRAGTRPVPDEFRPAQVIERVLRRQVPEPVSDAVAAVAAWFEANRDSLREAVLTPTVGGGWLTTSVLLFDEKGWKPASRRLGLGEGLFPTPVVSVSLFELAPGVVRQRSRVSGSGRTLMLLDVLVPGLPGMRLRRSGEQRWPAIEGHWLVLGDVAEWDDVNGSDAATITLEIELAPGLSPR